MKMSKYGINSSECHPTTVNEISLSFSLPKNDQNVFLFSGISVYVEISVFSSEV